MPDKISRQRLKKKALERWENEGGRTCTDAVGTPKGSALANVGSNNKTPQSTNARLTVFDEARDKKPDAGFQPDES